MGPATAAPTDPPVDLPVDPSGETTAQHAGGSVGIAFALSVVGPAFIVSIAYVDPGNFASNLQAGGEFGYRLAWVVLAANLMAMPVQYLAAKLGVVTGQGLAALLGPRCRRPVGWLLWIQAEVVAMATDLAEFIGAAIGLHLLFGLTPIAAGLITAAVGLGLLTLRQHGWRRFELAIVGLLAVVAVGLVFETLRIGVSGNRLLSGLLPTLGAHGMATAAVAIVGATIMPHVIYLHSELTGERARGQSAKLRDGMLRLQAWEVAIALGAAGVVNMALLALGAALPHGTSDLPHAYAAIGQVAGGLAAVVFATALLASGISSASVGTLAGDVVMRGFTGLRLPLHVRRLATMAPALILLARGAAAGDALIASQIVLSFGTPFALLPLIRLTADPAVMGERANRLPITLPAAAVVVLVIAMNVYFLAGWLR